MSDGFQYLDILLFAGIAGFLIVRLWSVRTGKEVHRFEGHRGAVTALEFTPDGDALISGSRDSTALVWDMTSIRDQ